MKKEEIKDIEKKKKSTNSANENVENKDEKIFDHLRCIDRPGLWCGLSILLQRQSLPPADWRDHMLYRLR